MKKKFTTEEFIERAKRKHRNRYSYDSVVYKSYTESVVITCLKHGSFEQKPITHLRGVYWV